MSKPKTAKAALRVLIRHCRYTTVRGKRKKAYKVLGTKEYGQYSQLTQIINFGENKSLPSIDQLDPGTIVTVAGFDAYAGVVRCIHGNKYYAFLGWRLKDINREHRLHITNKDVTLIADFNHKHTCC